MMRIGAPVTGYTTPVEWVRLHAERGLGAAYWPLPEGAARAEEEAYCQAAAQAGLVIAEVGVWNNVLDADPAGQEANIRHAIARLRTADRVGARCCVNIAGSRSAQWDGPHPDNLTEETFGHVVRITQRILDEAAPTRTAYTLEPMPWMFPHDADSTQRLIDAIDRPGFGVHVDMVNMVNGYEKVYRTGDLVRAYFARFAPYIRSVHAKDVRIGTGLTLHIDEALPGEGLFDFDALLTACAGLRDVPVMAEHLPTEAAYAQAVAFLRERAQALGLPLDVARPCRDGGA